MRNKTVFVLLDGLQSEYAKEHLGYLEHLCEKNRAAKYEVLGELPSSSRPMYETIFTGVPVFEHGITNNGICRLSNQEHLFKLLKKANKKNLLWHIIGSVNYIYQHPMIKKKMSIMKMNYLVLIEGSFIMAILSQMITYIHFLQV